jgi:4-amino-4-deoxy-L-arabinose transferase-like glycosyltransferase
VYRTLIISILLGAFVLRLAAGYWWQQRLPEGVKFGFPDSEAYWALAQKIADRQPYELNPDRRVFRTPGYPALLAYLYRLDLCRLAGDEPPVMWARAINAFLGVLAVVAVMVLTAMLFDRKTAALAGAITAVYPSAISMSTFVLAEAPFCPLMLLQLIFWIKAWRARATKRKFRFAFGAGLVAGLATLVRPSWLLFTPLAVVFGTVGVLVFSRNPFGRKNDHSASPQEENPPASYRPSVTVVDRSFPQHALIGAALILGFVAAMSPWWYRNWKITGHFVPTTLQVGESLYDGLNPQATGASDMRFVDDFRSQLRAEDAKAVSGEVPQTGFEERLDNRMRDAAIDWAAGHPASVIRLAGIKFLRIWNVWPNEASLRHWGLRLVLMLAYLPVLLFAIHGAWRFARCGWPYVLCFLPAVYFTCLHVVFVGSIRYRQPAMLPLIAIAAGAMVQAARKWKPANRKEGLTHL